MRRDILILDHLPLRASMLALAFEIGRQDNRPTYAPVMIDALQYVPVPEQLTILPDTIPMPISEGHQASKPVLHAGRFGAMPIPSGKRKKFKPSRKRGR